MSNESRIEYLEVERQKIWERLTVIEGLIEKKTSDYEAEAKLSSEQATSFKESSKAANEEIIKSLEDTQTKLQSLRVNYETFETLFHEIKLQATESNSNNQLIEEIYSKVESQAKTISSQAIELQKIFDSKPLLDENLKKLEVIFKSGDEYDSKLSTLFKSITERKKEIDELYYEIVGFVEKDKDGNDTEVKGLKDELEESYTLLKEGFADTEKKLTELNDSQIKSFTDFTLEKKAEFEELSKNWNTEYTTVLQKIEELLPHALTTGLSYAYSEKKANEEEENKNHLKSFRAAIWGLVTISLIPFSVSGYSLITDVPLETVILRIPRIVLSILPLYLPILWVAYSANRKMNLAKRLIEEYSHKEVLSKTFEGLSKQINSIDDKDISNDLRIRLLYNILEVSSENPGKLISDYNKSDHPLMDALDKSIKLTNAVTKLSKIPGFSKLAATLEKKSNDILAIEGLKAEVGLAVIENEKEKA